MEIKLRKVANGFVVTVPSQNSNMAAPHMPTVNGQEHVFTDLDAAVAFIKTQY